MFHDKIGRVISKINNAKFEHGRVSSAANCRTIFQMKHCKICEVNWLNHRIIGNNLGTILKIRRAKY